MRRIVNLSPVPPKCTHFVFEGEIGRGFFVLLCIYRSRGENIDRERGRRRGREKVCKREIKCEQRKEREKEKVERKEKKRKRKRPGRVGTRRTK